MALACTYALVAYALVLAWTTTGDRVPTPRDAAETSLLGILLLGVIPLGWARSRLGFLAAALAEAHWAWTLPGTMVGAASGILLFATFHAPATVVLPWPATALYGLTAAVAEELFFRGHLQTHIGWYQVPLFAALHGPAGLPVALAAGVLFTLLSRLGLGASVAAHAAYNLSTIL
ncbi:MAG: CPBP family intramembrane metalloprotease [Halobacteriales archaeon]|nr:CPBP family intramembrane metalloprotease [Halobacteriales archaeon]